MKLTDELAAVDLGDRRLNQRLVAITEQLVGQPSASFPVAAGGDAPLEATYRFLNNEAVTPDRILAPHVRATVCRVIATGAVLVPHDTTEVRPCGQADVGWLNRRVRGFLAHFAIALSDDNTRRPLGVLGLRTLVRSRDPKDRSTRRRRRFDAESEERRWIDLVDDIEAQIAGRASAIHIMDCEADSYRLFCALVAQDRRFVVRMTFDRRVNGEAQLMSEAFRRTTVVLTREVALAARRKSSNPNIRRAHPPRQARVAKLSVSAQRMTLLRPDWAGKACPEQLDIHVVRVWEESPPTGATPVEWRLVTTEPIATAEDVARIVDIYRARWIIEEYFKALKTGCALERRQLENRRSFFNALAVFAPIAYQLLLLRALSRAAPTEAAGAALTPLRIAILERHPRVDLPAGATVREAMLAIAQLGGHITNNGEPGWLVLGRGYEKLLLLEEGAMLMPNCDQS
jgi:hypothetical protein